MIELSLSDLFSSPADTSVCHIESAHRFHRSTDWGELIRDQFGEAVCLFIRISSPQPVSLTVEAPVSFQASEIGGFVTGATSGEGDSYWVPRLPTAREINAQQQILSEKNAAPTDWKIGDGRFSLSFAPANGEALDLVIWKFAPQSSLAQTLQQLAPIETEEQFLWGSHSCYRKPGDLYEQLVFGTLFDVRFSWPHKKKCASENEAHALYTVYAGLEKWTGKAIYRLFQEQLVLSLIARQSEDGGWYHGIWTDESECHYRLHASGVHLLLDEYQRTGCEQVNVSLDKAVSFLAKTTDQLDCGAWFLHDSLELSEVSMNTGSFKWIPNKTLGKSPSNMLVLNTHLDSTIAINRYGRLTGDKQYQPLIESAHDSTRTVLALQPANWLYKPLFKAIALTMLPTERAAVLPAPVRAIKRLAWQYLIKKLPDIKARFPRIVMPNGYIDRELSLRTWAIDYQTINLMDLARYARAFPGVLEEPILDKAMDFTQTSGLIERYRELQPGKRYAPGFWMEALYHRCLEKNDPKYREWLAQAMIECHRLGLGLAPSLLGANGEALGPQAGMSSKIPEINGLLFANLSHDRQQEIMLVNPFNEPFSLDRLPADYIALEWRDSSNEVLSKLKVPANGWLRGTNS